MKRPTQLSLGMLHVAMAARLAGLKMRSLLWLFLLISTTDSSYSQSQGQRDAQNCQKLSPKPLRSRHLSEIELNVTLTNAGEEQLDLYWIDYEGSEVFIDSIDQDDTTVFTTYAGHVWRANLHTSGETHFEKMMTPEDHDKVIPVGIGCKKSIFGINYTEYTFKTISDIVMIPDPKQVQQDIIRSPCQSIGLANWINKYVAAPGYHVVCLTKSKDLLADGTWRISIEAWRDGFDVVNQNSGQTFTGSSYLDLRRHIESILAINKIHTDAHLKFLSSEILKLKSPNRESRTANNWEYLPQNWALFTTDRLRVQGIEDLNSLFKKNSQSFFSTFFSSSTSLIALVMEGGQFVYPGIDLGFSRTIRTHDKAIELVTLSMRPLILRMENFLTPEEIKYIVDKSSPEMKASPVSLMDKDVGKSAAEFRTSQQYFLSARGSVPLQNLERRVADLTGCATIQQETLQVLKYEKGQYYLPHLDYWDPVYYQSPVEVARSHAGHKNRLSTVFWYLSDCDGGHTAFPLAPTDRPHVSQTLPEREGNAKRYYFTVGSRENHLEHTLRCEYGLRIPPKVGSAILFYSLLPDGNGDQFSQHAACAVVDGTKWAANKWVWNMAA